MSEPTVQPAPKKGLSTGIKILIGCLIGVLLVVAACGSLKTICPLTVTRCALLG